VNRTRRGRVHPTVRTLSDPSIFGVPRKPKMHANLSISAGTGRQIQRKLPACSFCVIMEKTGMAGAEGPSANAEDVWYAEKNKSGFTEVVP